MAVKTVLLLCTLVSAGESTAAVSHHKSRPRQANSALEARVKLRHAFHSSAVLNEWLYVDGGEFSSWNGDNVIYQYADTIVSIDLRQDWTNHSVSSRSTAKPPQAASLKNGGIWVDHKNGVLYTGFAGRESTFGDNIIYPQGLWSFTPDGSGSGAWENLNETADARFVALPRPYMGQVASGNGLGFFLGGLIGYKSDKQTIFSSLTTYNLSTHELSNLVAPGVSNPGLEQMGGMIYVPNFGNQGILVNMGGFHDGRVEANGLISFRRVRVYDPESQRWFEQTATGEIPQPRKEFCIAGAPSSNHTYEVLIYAGYGGELGPAAIPYDSAFVLTIPGFYWVRARYKPEKPRHGLTCELVSGSQVLIVGGVDSTQRNATDAEDDYHGVFNTPDPFLAGLAIFDLTRLRFEPAYVAKQEEPYRAAPEIRDYYSTRGSKPETGFASPALEALFSVQNFDDANVSQTNAAAITRKSNAAAITGGVVGGVGCLVMAISFAVCLRRRRRRRNRPEMQPDEPSLPAPARDLALPCATQNAPVTTEVLHDKPREEATQESRQEMPSQDRREGRAEMSEQGLVAELPGDSSWVGGGDAKLSGHNRQISDLCQPTEESDDAGNEVVDEEGARKRDDVDECI